MLVTWGVTKGGAGPPIPTVFIVFDSIGNAYIVPFQVLDSFNNSYTVTQIVLASDNTPYTVL